MILKNNTLWQCSCHCNTLFVTYEFVSWITFQIRLSSGRVDSSEQHNGKCCMVLNCFWVICLHLHSTIWNCFCLFLLICSESGPWIGSKNVVHSTWAALSEVSFMTRMCDFYSVKESLHKKILCFFLWKLLSFGFWKFWRKRDPSFWTQEKWKNGWPHVSVCLIHCWVDDLFWIQSWVGWLEHTKHGICWLSEVHFLRIQMCSFYRWKESLHMKSSSYFALEVLCLAPESLGETETQSFRIQEKGEKWMDWWLYVGMIHQCLCMGKFLLYAQIVSFQAWMVLDSSEH